MVVLILLLDDTINNALESVILDVVIAGNQYTDGFFCILVRKIVFLFIMQFFLISQRVISR